MTLISFTKVFEKQFKKLPKHIQRKATLWMMSVEKYGLRKVRERPSYHDEPLKGARSGQRSIRLNQKYRLIYIEIDQYIHIVLMEVHAHDY